jgi:hypothetical protein
VGELEQRLTRPEVWADPEASKQIQRERSRVQGEIEVEG